MRGMGGLRHCCVVALVAVAASLAACGDDDDTSAGPDLPQHDGRSAKAAGTAPLGKPYP